MPMSWKANAEDGATPSTIRASRIRPRPSRKSDKCASPSIEDFHAAEMARTEAKIEKAQLRKKPRGKPFARGFDPRRKIIRSKQAEDKA
jgi:hypothetical protein